MCVCVCVCVVPTSPPLDGENLTIRLVVAPGDKSRRALRISNGP